MNLTEPIWRNAATWPDRIAFVSDGIPYTYRKFRRMVARVASRLAQMGVRRGSCIGISTRNPLVFLVVVLAAARMGAITTPAKPKLPARLRDEMLERLGVSLLVQDPSEEWRSTHLGPDRHVGAQKLFAAAAEGETFPQAPVAEDAGDETFFIALSSGTTGRPKAIPVGHDRSILNGSLGRRAAAMDSQRVMLLSDIAINMTISNCLRVLLGGGTLIFATSADPAHVFEAIRRDRPDRLIATTAFGVRLCGFAAQKLPESRAWCASVTSLSVTGSAASPATQEMLMRHICPALEVSYGSTEAGGIAIATAEMLRRNPRSAGRVFPWVRVQAVDDDHRPLPTGEAGLLRFRTPTLVKEYLDDEDATRNAFRDGWFYSGDMGSVDTSGEITLVGRADHLINIGGRKVDPVAIEQVLNGHPAVLESVVVAQERKAQGQRLVAVVVDRAPVTDAELAALCKQHFAEARVPRRFLRARELPKNEGGKIMRDAVAREVAKEAFADG